jgi:transcription factor S
MLFCPKCSSILMPKVDKNKKLLVCSCGFKKEAEENLVIKETISQKSESTGAGVAEDKEILPLVDADCPKCKHIKAYNWIIQTRAADEAPTRFFKCEKCKHTWREYK